METSKNRPQDLLLLALLAFLYAFAGVIGTIVLVGAILPYYLVVVLAAKVLRPDLGPAVSGLTAAFTVNPQDKCAANLLHFLILDGSMTRERFTSLFDQRVINCKRPDGQLKFPRFRDAWTEFCGYTFWKPEKNFSTEAHIRDYDLQGELRLPVPCYEQDLRRIIGPITAKAWSPDKSPWEILMIHDYRLNEQDLEPKTIAFFRHHHALIDGYGMVTFMRELCQCKFPLPSLNVKSPPLWVRALATLKVPWDMAKMKLETADGLTEWHVEPTSERFFTVGMTGTVPISTVKVIKNKLGVSYTTVLFAAVAGAIEKFSQREKIRVPKSLGVYAPLPMPDHPGGTVNHVVLMGMKWQIESGTPLERVYAIERMLQEIKGSTVPLIGSLLAGGIGLIPTLLRRGFLFKFFLSGGSAVVSCFPPTPDTIYLDGVKIHDLISSVGSLGQLSMTILITGINGAQHVVITGDTRVFPAETFHRIGSYMEEELNGFLRQCKAG